MAIAVAILVAVLAGAVLVYWFYLRKPAKKDVPVPPAAPVAPAEDEVEITEEELASLKEIPTLKTELEALTEVIKELRREVMADQAEEEPEPPKEEWEEVQVKPDLILKFKKNGHAAPVAEAPPPEESNGRKHSGFASLTPEQRRKMGQEASKKRWPKKTEVQEGP